MCMSAWSPPAKAIHQCRDRFGGKAGGSDVSLVARALGDPDKPGEAKIAIDGSVTGERPQAVLVLLFPDLPVERLAAAGQNKGKLTVKLAGVPNARISGKAALETGSMGVAFEVKARCNRVDLPSPAKGRW